MNFAAIWTSAQVLHAAGNQSEVTATTIMEDVRVFYEVCKEF